MTAPSKLALGTVQWGMPYGIANRTGRPDLETVAAILQRGRTGGIRLLDTAQAYGEAEARLGQLQAAKMFQVVTKLPRVPEKEITAPGAAAIGESLRQSLDRLQAPQVHGLMLHHADDLLLPGAAHLWAALAREKAAGRVGKIGVSLYHPRQLEQLWPRWPLEIVQLPFNLYDQRFLASGWLDRLKSAGVEIHARSAFLQGLLLLDDGELPAHFAPVRQHHRRVRGRLQAAGFSPLAGALNFALLQPAIDQVVVGCERLEQLEELLSVPGQNRAFPTDYATFALAQERYLDPSQWP